MDKEPMTHVGYNKVTNDLEFLKLSYNTFVNIQHMNSLTELSIWNNNIINLNDLDLSNFDNMKKLDFFSHSSKINNILY